MSLNMQSGSLMQAAITRAVYGIPFMAALCLGAADPQAQQGFQEDFVCVRLRFDDTDDRSKGGNKEYLAQGIQKRTVAKLLRRALLAEGSSDRLIPDEFILRRTGFNGAVLNDFIINFPRNRNCDWSDRMLAGLERNKFRTWPGTSEFRSLWLAIPFGTGHNKDGTGSDGTGYLRVCFSQALNPEYYEQLPRGSRRTQTCPAQLEFLRVPEAYRVSNMTNAGVLAEMTEAQQVQLALRMSLMMNPQASEPAAFQMYDPQHPGGAASPVMVESKKVPRPKPKATKAPVTDVTFATLKAVQVPKVIVKIILSDEESYYCKPMCVKKLLFVECLRCFKKRLDLDWDVKPKQFKIEISRKDFHAPVPTDETTDDGKPVWAIRKFE